MESVLSISNRKDSEVKEDSNTVMNNNNNHSNNNNGTNIGKNKTNKKLFDSTYSDIKWDYLDFVLKHGRKNTVNINDSNENVNKYVISSHHHRITDLEISNDNKYLYSTSDDSTLSIYDIGSKHTIKSIKVSHLALSSCCNGYDKQNNALINIGSWDNTIYVYNRQLDSVVSKLKEHGDAISCLTSDSTTNKLYSGSWDNTIKIWDNHSNKSLITYKIDSELRCLSNCKIIQPNIFISGDENGNILMFDIRSNNNHKSIRSFRQAHKNQITSLSWLPNKFEFLSVSSDCNIKYWNGNGKLIYTVSTRENLTTIKNDGNLIISGGELGHMRIWNLNDNHKIDEITKHSLISSSINSHSISSIAITNNSKHVFIGTKSFKDNILVFELNKNKTNNNNVGNHTYINHDTSKSDGNIIFREQIYKNDSDKPMWMVVRDKNKQNNKTIKTRPPPIPVKKSKSYDNNNDINNNNNNSNKGNIFKSKSFSMFSRISQSASSLFQFTNK